MLDLRHLFIVEHMEINIEKIARTCHEVNKVYCESIGDFTQVHWDDCPDWQKESAMNGVKYMIDNPNTTSEEIHNNWMSEKKANGWRYGIVKDSYAKTHPCMIPYNFLSEEQRLKDKLFISIVRSIYL